ncbi:MAG: FkbM family methyltransferase [Verrucomicrobiales bacterium]|nr:FkbM family methyltransferase [Verrucomicrobiales bacterium]
MLKRRHRRLVPVNPNEPTGVDLREDLNIVLPHSAPLIFDVGANVGQSIDLFQSIYPRAVIHAFEPSPECLKVLSSRHPDQRVSIHPVALGARQEELTFHEYELSVLNSVLPIDRKSEHQFNSVSALRQIKVHADTIDRVADDLGIDKIDLLKIDTQGFDLAVLHGASGVLSRKQVQAVMVELNFISIYEGQSSVMEILSLLFGHNFELVDFYEKFRQGSTLAWCTALFSKRIEVSS